MQRICFYLLSLLLLCATTVTNGLDIVFDLPAQMRHNTSQNVILTTFNALGNEHLTIRIRVRVRSSNRLIFNEEHNRIATGAVETHGFALALNPSTSQCQKPNGVVTETLCDCVIDIEVTSSTRNSWATSRNVPLMAKKAHIFLATDRPVYRPGDKVYARFIPVDDRLKPLKASMAMTITAPNPTPGGANLESWSKNKAPSKGVFVRSFRLPDTPPIGEWKVKARFISNQIESTEYTSSFYVEEYTLPTFDVSIRPESSFILPDDTTFTFAVAAKYIHGETLRGTAHVRFGYLDQSGNLLETTHIEQVKQFATSHTFNVRVSSLVGHSTISNLANANARLFMEASVTDHAQGMTRTIQNTKVMFTGAPFVLSFGDTPGYYKPSLNFNLQVTAKYANGSEASNVAVRIEATEERNDGRFRSVHQERQMTGKEGGSLSTSFTAPANSRNMVIIAAADYISANGNTYPSSIQRTFQPQTSTYDEFLQIVLPQGKLQVGKMIAIEINVTPSSRYRTIVYTVTGRNQLLEQGKAAVSLNRNRVAISFIVTPEMSPLSHITAYYVTPRHASSYITADSALLRVADSCQGVEPRMQVVLVDQVPYPGQELSIEILGQPTAFVGMTGVDAAALSLRKDYFPESDTGAATTRKNSFEVLRKFASNCQSLSMPSPQYAFNAIGRNLASSVANGMTTPGAPACSNATTTRSSRRRRRRSVIVDASLLLRKGYSGLNYDCCAVGASNINDVVKFPDVATYCEKRMKHVKDLDCRSVFFECCVEAQCKRGDLPAAGCGIDRRVVSFGSINPTGGTGFEVVYKKATRLRSNFDDTWFAIDFQLGSSGQRILNNASRPGIPPLPHSITSWSVEMFSLSADYGMCVLKPFLFPVQHELYIDVNVPSVPVMRGTLVHIEITVFSYMGSRVEATIVLEEKEHLCGSQDQASPGGVTRRVSLDPSSRGIPSTEVVRFSLMPLKRGKHKIRVTMSSYMNTPEPSVVDRVEKVLEVVAEGEMRRTVMWKLVGERPSSVNRRSPTSIRNLKLDLPSEVIPGTETASVTLHDIGSAAIRRPSLDADDNTIAQYVYLLQYAVNRLRLAKAGNHLTDSQLINITNDAQSAYVGLLSFANDLTNGSLPQYAFSYIPAPQSNVDLWLTSTTWRLLVESAELLAPDEKILQGCLNWILRHQNMRSGLFDNQPKAAPSRTKRSSCQELRSKLDRNRCRMRRSVDKTNLRLPKFKSSRDRKVYRTSVIGIEMHVVRKRVIEWSAGGLHPLLPNNEISRDNRLKSVKRLKLDSSVRLAAAFVLGRIRRLHKLRSSAITLTSSSLFLQLAMGRNAHRLLPKLTASTAKFIRPENNNQADVKWIKAITADESTMNENQRIQAKSATVEATAYYLNRLALRDARTRDAPKFFNYLVERNDRWVSLRDSLAAMRAVGEFAISDANSQRPNTLRVQISTPTDPATPIISPATLGDQGPTVSSATLPLTSDSLSVTTLGGTGQEAWLELNLEYNVATRSSPVPGGASAATTGASTVIRDLNACPYNATVKVKSVSPFMAFSVHGASTRSSQRLSKEFYSVNLVVKFNEGPLTEVEQQTFVVDIGLGTDVTPLESDLKLLTNPVESWIDHYRLTKRAVILYITGECDISLRLKAPAGTLTDFPVRIYPAAFPDQKCTVSYRFTQPLIANLCAEADSTSSSNMCACAVGHTCPTFIKKSVSVGRTANDRVALTCSSDTTYALRIHIDVEPVEMNNWLVLNATIIENYKSCGAANGITKNSVQTFWIKDACDRVYRANKEYLVLGKHAVQSNGRNHKLLLDANSSVEWWPASRCTSYTGTKNTICNALDFYHYLMSDPTYPCQPSC